MKTVITIILTLSLAACGTISGMGKDITSTADWTKEKLSSSKSK
jgi:predicted small secreted protein